VTYGGFFVGLGYEFHTNSLGGYENDSVLGIYLIIVVLALISLWSHAGLERLLTPRN